MTADPQLYFRMFTDEAFGRQYLRESERPVQHKALLYFNAGHPRIDSIVFDSIPADRVIIDLNHATAIRSRCGSTFLRPVCPIPSGEKLPT